VLTLHIWARRQGRSANVDLKKPLVIQNRQAVWGVARIRGNADSGGITLRNLGGRISAAWIANATLAFFLLENTLRLWPAHLASAQLSASPFQSRFSGQAGKRPFVQAG
jgi:hypothetical protein